MRMGERTKRVLALLTAGAMVFTNTGMDVLASTSIVVGGITSGEDKKDETLRLSLRANQKQALNRNRNPRVRRAVKQRVKLHTQIRKYLPVKEIRPQ